MPKNERENDKLRIAEVGHGEEEKHIKQNLQLDLKSHT